MKACQSVFWLYGAVIGLLLGASPVEAQKVYCVRAGATGAGNGLDWTNAYTDLPATVTRGATYYVAGGNYLTNGRTFSTADSGTNLIKILAATTTDHGTNGGWSDAYDSQSVFSSTLYFSTDYWIFDGQKRTNWNGGYRFKVVWRSGGTDLIDLGWITVCSSSYNVIRYVELQGAYDRAGSVVDRGIVMAPGGHDNRIECCYLHDIFVPNKSINVQNVTYQSNYIARNCYTADQHSGGYVINGTCTNIIVRWNRFIDVCGTACFETPAVGHPQCAGDSFMNWYVYGNVIANTAWGNTNQPGFGNGIFYLFDMQMHGDMMFYNNTIANIRSGLSIFIGCESGGTSDACADHFYVRNNLFWNNAFPVAPASADVTDFKWEYNSYFNQSYSDTNANLQVASGVLPFVNSNSDWHLTQATSNGLALASPFNADADGHIRGTDGIGDRGAYEYNATNTPPSVSLTAPVSGAIISNTVTLSATATGSTNGSAVSNVTFLVDGSVVGICSNTPYTAAWDSSTVTNGSHSFQASAQDLTGNQAASSIVWVAVENPISAPTPPSVSLTAPVSGAIISNTVTVSATATGSTNGSAVSNVTFLVDGRTVGICSNTPYSISWNSRGVTNGSHSLQASAQDLAGNQATSSIVLATVGNPISALTPPSVSLTAPVSGAIISNTVTLSATATGNTNGSVMSNVTFWVDGSAVGICSNTPYTVTWDSSTVTNGSHSFQASAQDNAGNTALSDSAMVAVQNPVFSISGEVGYWGFDDSAGTFALGMALDVSGNGNHATLLNGPARVAGKVGEALQFDGIASYVRVPNSASLDPTAAVSVSAWVQLSTNGAYQVILEKLAAEGANTYPFCDYGLVAVNVGGGYHGRASVTLGGNFVYVDSTSVISYVEWHYLTSVYDGAALTIYVDGIASGTVAASGSIRTDGQALFIGHNGAGGDSLKGIVDEVRVFNQALPAAEVNWLYTNQTPPLPPSHLDLNIKTN